MDTQEPIFEDNPATRLYAILHDLRSYKPQTGGGNNNKPTLLEAWSSVLNINPEDKASVIKGILAVEELGQHIMQEVIVMQLDEDLYTGTLEQHLPGIIHPITLQSTHERIVLNIPDTLLQELRFCGEKFENYISVAPAQHASEIKELILQVEGLIAQITFSKLPIELKTAFLTNANGIRESLILFHITGYSGLKESLNAIAGFAVLREEDMKIAAEDPENMEVMANLAKLAGAVDSITAFADKQYKRYKTLRHPIKSFLKHIDDNADSADAPQEPGMLDAESVEPEES